jgi:hypothetical protein
MIIISPIILYNIHGNTKRVTEHWSSQHLLLYALSQDSPRSHDECMCEHWDYLVDVMSHEDHSWSIGLTADLLQSL